MRLFSKSYILDVWKGSEYTSKSNIDVVSHEWISAMAYAVNEMAVW